MPLEPVGIVRTAMPVTDLELQFLLTHGAHIVADVERALREDNVTAFGIADVRHWHARALTYLEAQGVSRAALEAEVGTDDAYVQAQSLAESYGRLRAVMSMLEASRAAAAPESRTLDAAFEFDVFISYSDKDRQEAGAIYDALHGAGRRAFMASKSLRGGDDFAESIRKALLASRELWLLVTPHSAKSDWVLSEWGAAWVLGRRIVPILLRYAPEQLPERLQKLHTVDFHALDTLVRATSASDRPG